MLFNANTKFLDKVEKIYKTKEGIFVNIMNDLSVFVKDFNGYNNDNKLDMMSYAYTRRVVSCAIFLQGIFNKEQLQYQERMFYYTQLNTDKSVYFQEKALENAIELLLSYHNDLKKEIVTLIVKFAITQMPYSYYYKNDNYNYISDNELISIVKFYKNKILQD